MCYVVQYYVEYMHACCMVDPFTVTDLARRAGKSQPDAYIINKRVLKKEPTGAAGRSPRFPGGLNAGRDCCYTDFDTVVCCRVVASTAALHR